MRFVPKWRLRKPAEDAETVYVSEKYGVRSLHIGSDTVQSSMRIARPNDLELSYTRGDDGVPAVQPGAAHGADGRAGRRLAGEVRLPSAAPDAAIRVLEIDPQVVAIARQCFLVPPDDARFRVTVGDGAGVHGAVRRCR